MLLTFVFNFYAGTAEVLEQVLEEDEDEDVSDNNSVFHPSDASDSSDSDDDNKKDYDVDVDDDVFCETAVKSRTRGEVGYPLNDMVLISKYMDEVVNVSDNLNECF